MNKYIIYPNSILLALSLTTSIQAAPLIGTTSINQLSLCTQSASILNKSNQYLQYKQRTKTAIREKEGLGNHAKQLNQQLNQELREASRQIERKAHREGTSQRDLAKDIREIARSILHSPKCR